MRHLIAHVFCGLAIWRAFIDWQATMGQGNACRFASGDAVWQPLSPESHEIYVLLLQKSTIPYLWDPVLSTLLGLPVALLLFGVGLFFWLISGRKKTFQRQRPSKKTNLFRPEILRGTLGFLCAHHSAT